MYHNRLKEAIGVSVQTLEQHGAVSEEIAAEMAGAVRRWAGTDIGLAETGIAGSKGASEERPAGLFYIAVASADDVLSEKLMLDGDRSENKLACAESALRLLLRYVRRGA